MSSLSQPKRVRVLFDEAHSESWSACRDRARAISPGYPEYSSYQSASDLLSQRDFEVRRHTTGPITGPVLQGVDLLIIPHPCDPRWERTLPGGSPRLGSLEIAEVQRFVKAGGGLLVITEYEHDKYGDNLNELLAPFGIQIENSTVLDRAHCQGGNPAWVVAEPAATSPAAQITLGARSICFYQAGHCTLSGPAQAILGASASASIPHACLMAVSQAGKGRVSVLTDSLLFGDDYITSPDHGRLWLNLCYWLALPGFLQGTRPGASRSAAASAPWKELKECVNRLRSRQSSDGSVPGDLRVQADDETSQILIHLRDLAPLFPQQKRYFEALQADFEEWRRSGFSKPDFHGALQEFHPEQHREDGVEHFVLFPLYTPNASLDVRFEALITRMPWPDWLAHLERTAYANPQFAPGHLVDFTEGYQSECAVLFPETVSIAGKASHTFATIFCDREARRLQDTATRAARATGLLMPAEFECLLASVPLMEDTVALWDLIHDRSHSLGELPFDPFMIRQRAPFWMYAIEELRVDLRSFTEARRLVGEGFHMARYVPCAIVLDRIFRFPITGTRVKNYDGLAGQLLFAFLHEREALVWCDNRLALDWERLPAVVDELRIQLAALYRHGATCSKLSLWLEAHDLISSYVRPNVASRWKKESRVIDSESDPSRWIVLVQDDEFPLGHFHMSLKRRLSKEHRRLL